MGRGPRFEHPEYGREPPRDFGGYYPGPPDRFLDGRPRPYYDTEDRFREYDRDYRGFDYRYDDNFFRGGFERDDEHLRESRRGGRIRGQVRDLSPTSRGSGPNEASGTSSRNKDESRSAKKIKKEDSDDVEHRKKRSLDRKDRSKKKKSKRRTRSRSRSSSPP